MTTFTITFADGDDFTKTFTSTVSVIGTSFDARLVAEQMVYTPMPGKPDHIQIIKTQEVTS